MLDEILRHLRNYFVCSVKRGTFEIKNGIIAPLDLPNEQYFRIVGSVFNDGVYQYPASGLTDEVFEGEIWAMAVPSALIALADEIKAYNESDMAKVSPYDSEAFGGYSYTRAADEHGAALSWERLFAGKLNKWRKL